MVEPEVEILEVVDDREEVVPEEDKEDEILEVVDDREEVVPEEDKEEEVVDNREGNVAVFRYKEVKYKNVGEEIVHKAGGKVI